MTDIDRPDWSTPDEAHEVGRSTPIGTPIFRPNWGNGGEDEGIVVGMKMSPAPARREMGQSVGLRRARGEPYRPNWGPATADDKTYHVKGPEFPNVATDEDEPKPKPVGPHATDVKAGEIPPAVAAHFSQALGKSGASPAVSNAALDWMRGVERDRTTTANEKAFHIYDFRNVDLPDEARAHLDSFGNRMAEQGASQHEVMAAIEWYSDLQAKIAAHDGQQRNEQASANRANEAAENQHKDLGTRTLRDDWGVDYEANIASIVEHLDSLPADERRFLERSRNQQGVRFGNDPARLKEFLLEAQSRQDDGLTRAEIESIMRTDRSRYQSDPRMQARYRQLLRRSIKGDSR